MICEDNFVAHCPGIHQSFMTKCRESLMAVNHSNFLASEYGPYNGKCSIKRGKRGLHKERSPSNIDETPLPDEQQDEPTDEQTDEQKDEQQYEQTDEQTDEQKDEQQDEQTDEQTDERIIDTNDHGTTWIPNQMEVPDEHTNNRHARGMTEHPDRERRPDHDCSLDRTTVTNEDINLVPAPTRPRSDRRPMVVPTTNSSQTTLRSDSDQPSTSLVQDPMVLPTGPMTRSRSQAFRKQLKEIISGLLKTTGHSEASPHALILIQSKEIQ